MPEPANEQPGGAGAPSDAPAASSPSSGGFRLSERDRIIQQLNHQGFSNRAISRTLSTSYDIELSESGVRRHLLEMYQDPDNGIRVNFEATYRKPREEKRWYNIVLELQKMIPAYTKRMGYKPSVRTMFYALQDLGLVKPEDFKKILLAWVDSHYDKKIYRDMVKEYSDVAPDPERMTDDEVVQAHDEMWEKVKSAFCKTARPQPRPDSGEREGEDAEDARP